MMKLTDISNLKIICLVYRVEMYASVEKGLKRDLQNINLLKYRERLDLQSIETY